MNQACRAPAPDAGLDAGQLEALDGGVCDSAGMCRRGFSCRDGRCKLDGTGGRLQVILRWSVDQDLDLYLDEPGAQSSCTVFLNSGDYCVGRIGADSCAFCRHDSTRVETINYPEDGGIPAGHYEVIVRYQQACMPAPERFDFEVEIRRDVGTTVVRHTIVGAEFFTSGHSNIPVFAFDVP